jgi:hypothetical protein
MSLSLKTAEKSAAPAPKVADKPKPYVIPRQQLIAAPEQRRAHIVFDVPSDVPYERLLQSDAYFNVSARVGDLVELRWSPGLRHWALLVVTNLLPRGAQVAELIHKELEPVDAASWAEQSDFEAVAGERLNQWRVRRKSDGVLMPGDHPTLEAARSEIARVHIPAWSGRGWSRSS